MTWYLTLVRDTLWPSGIKPESSNSFLREIRKESQRQRTREDAIQKGLVLFPGRIIIPNLKLDLNLLSSLSLDWIQLQF